jgi:hypothetical protein
MAWMAGKMPVELAGWKPALLPVCAHKLFIGRFKHKKVMV